MLALFSTGPMGFSDAPGETDAALPRRVRDANGTLLQPSRPITSVDSTFDVTPGAAPQGGCVLGTHTALSSGGPSSSSWVARTSSSRTNWRRTSPCAALDVCRRR